MAKIATEVLSKRGLLGTSGVNRNRVPLPRPMEIPALGSYLGRLLIPQVIRNISYASKVSVSLP